LERERFEELAAEAIDSLPQQFQDKLENVAVIVEYWPTLRQVRRLGLREREQLLGLYEGVPLTAFGRDHATILPEKITIFQRPIELAYRTDERIVRGIEETVRHEIAHHFGMSDEKIYDITRRKKRGGDAQGADGGNND
jgi:predicted Zn-dependent protease with MMP-like domain